VYEGDRKVMHHILKYERLHEDFAELTLPAKHENHVRKSIKPLGVDDLSAAVIDLIETVYANDFREFGYQLLSTTRNATVKSDRKAVLVSNDTSTGTLEKQNMPYQRLELSIFLKLVMQS
jgi:hypothetical protein